LKSFLLQRNIWGKTITKTTATETAVAAAAAATTTTTTTTIIRLQPKYLAKYK